MSAIESVVKQHTPVQLVTQEKTRGKTRPFADGPIRRGTCGSSLNCPAAACLALGRAENSVEGNRDAVMALQPGLMAVCAPALRLTCCHVSTVFSTKLSGRVMASAVG